MRAWANLVTSPRSGGPTIGKRDPLLLAVVVIAILACSNLALNLFVPSGLHLVTYAGVSAGLLVLVRLHGMTWQDLGLDRSHFRVIRRGWWLAGLIVAVMALRALIPASREFLADQRFVGVSAGSAAWKTLVEIPLTVGFEELAFRGVLLGLLLRSFTPPLAVVLASSLFGLWHVLPTLDLAPTVETGLPSGAVIAGVMLFTSAAGALFAWLRISDRTVASPLLVHLTVNGVAYAAGWSIVRWEL